MGQMKKIRVQRVYERRPRDRETAFLVDRLWPRGIRKEALAIKAWTRDVGPSDRLRHWFGHDPAKWPEFKRRYFRELKEKPGVWQPLMEAARKGPITLLFAAKDAEHNNAVALKEFLQRRTGT